MVNIIKEELPIEESLKRKLELICKFSKTTPTIINGNIRKIDKNDWRDVRILKILSNEIYKGDYISCKTLNNNIKDKEISFLKSKISSLKNTIEYWKDKFDKLI